MAESYDLGTLYFDAEVRFGKAEAQIRAFEQKSGTTFAGASGGGGGGSTSATISPGASAVGGGGSSMGGSGFVSPGAHGAIGGGGGRRAAPARGIAEASEAMGRWEQAYSLFSDVSGGAGYNPRYDSGIFNSARPGPAGLPHPFTNPVGYDGFYERYNSLGSRAARGVRGAFTRDILPAGARQALGPYGALVGPAAIAIGARETFSVAQAGMDGAVGTSLATSAQGLLSAASGGANALTSGLVGGAVGMGLDLFGYGPRAIGRTGQIEGARSNALSAARDIGIERSRLSAISGYRGDLLGAGYGVAGERATIEANRQRAVGAAQDVISASSIAGSMGNTWFERAMGYQTGGDVARMNTTNARGQIGNANAAASQAGRELDAKVADFNRVVAQQTAVAQASLNVLAQRLSGNQTGAGLAAITGVRGAERSGLATSLARSGATDENIAAQLGVYDRTTAGMASEYKQGFVTQITSAFEANQALRLGRTGYTQAAGEAGVRSAMEVNMRGGKMFFGATGPSDAAYPFLQGQYNERVRAVGDEVASNGILARSAFEVSQIAARGRPFDAQRQAANDRFTAATRNKGRDSSEFINAQNVLAGELTGIGYAQDRYSRDLDLGVGTQRDQLRYQLGRNTVGASAAGIAGGVIGAFNAASDSQATLEQRRGILGNGVQQLEILQRDYLLGFRGQATSRFSDFQNPRDTQSPGSVVSSIQDAVAKILTKLDSLGTD